MSKPLEIGTKYVAFKAWTYTLRSSRILSGKDNLTQFLSISLQTVVSKQ